jgi:cell division control protein 7
MLFFLSGKFPIFAASSDMEALMEQASILGRDVMENTAALHSEPLPSSEVHALKVCIDRTFSTDIAAVEKRTSWSKFVQTLNPDLFNGEVVTSTDPASTRQVALLKHAVDLLTKCLDPDNVTRITARGALYHPFLARDAEERAGQPTNGIMERDDDELFPHPPGQGVCSDLHWRDQETGAWMAVDFERRERVLQAGEGQAIGYMGCELHPYVGCADGEEDPAAHT